jgi:N-acetyl-anhydromuramyl-L-alanine amidase AmpD
VEIIKKHLPSYCYSKHKIKSVDGIVIHFISAKNILPNDPFNLEAIIGIFKQYNVSANYLIRRNGTIIELVPKLFKSYHAGKSIMNGRERCNDFTIGVELEGGTDFPYTDEQILNLGTLSAQLMTEHKFTTEWIQGHDKVRANYKEKYPDKKASIKRDPGPHFPYEILNDMLYSVSLQVEHEQKIR